MLNILADILSMFDRGCQPTQMPTQKLKSEFSLFGSEDFFLNMLSFQIIFEAQQLDFENFKSSEIQPTH